MSLRTLSKKLRHAADVLDELIEVEETRIVAKKIQKNIVKKKLHWTQRPENKARMLKQLRKANRIKNGNQNT